MTSLKTISVVICTYNRAESLRRTLESFTKLSVPPELWWELIMVDNNSSDNTRAVIEEFALNSGLRVRYIFEGTQGLSHARNAGLREAQGELIAFTDDDVLPRPDWLAQIWQKFSHDMSLQIISGRVELLNPADLPITVRRGSEPVVFGSLFDAFNLMVGCNLAVRRALLDHIGHFDADLGAGSRFEAAEDSDFFFRAWRAGAKLVYEPSVFVFHDHGRRTSRDRVRIRRGYAIGRGAFYAKHLLQGDLSVLGAIRSEVVWAFSGLFKRGENLGLRPLVWLSMGFLGYGRIKATRSILPAKSKNECSSSA